MVGRRNRADLLVGLCSVVVVAVVFNLKCCEATRKASWDVVPPGCMNSTIYPYLCHPLTPPPPAAIPDYPSGGVPPPPSLPPPSPSTLPYPTDIVPPPPPSNCTTVPVQCCQYPPNPMGSGGYQPVTPPFGYGYQPVVNYSATLFSPAHLVSVIGVLVLSIIALL